MSDSRYIEVKEPTDEATKVTVDSQSSLPTPEPINSDYSYGRNQEPLDGNTAVRGMSGGTYFATATSVSATGDKTITGCPFVPKFARCTAVVGLTFTAPSVSVGAATGNPGSYVSCGKDAQDASNAYFVYLRDSSGTVVSRATFSSFTTDGCVINFSIQSLTTHFMVELFS